MPRPWTSVAWGLLLLAVAAGAHDVSSSFGAADSAKLERALAETSISPKNVYHLASALKSASTPKPFRPCLPLPSIPGANSLPLAVPCTFQRITSHARSNASTFRIMGSGMLQSGQKILCNSVTTGFASGNAVTMSQALRASVIAKCPVFKMPEMTAAMVQGGFHADALPSPVLPPSLPPSLPRRGPSLDRIHAHAK